MVTGLRAVRYRLAALACSFGAALVMVGISAIAVAAEAGLPIAWLAIGGTAALVGPVLMLAGAQRTANGPSEPDAVDEEGTFAGYPLLAVPVIIGVGAAVFRFVTGGHFSQTSIVLGLAAVTAVAFRETLAARDIRRYARRLAGQQAHFRALVSRLDRRDRRPRRQPDRALAVTGRGPPVRPVRPGRPRPAVHLAAASRRRRAGRGRR